jgi:hypothetical protein
MHIDFPYPICKIVLRSVIICLTGVGSSCNELSLTPFPTQTPIPLPSLTPTLEECSWSGYVLAWNDSNANGIRETTESPLSDIRFFTEGYIHKSDIFDWGLTGSGGSMSLIALLTGCPELQFAVYPEVPENCRLTTPARMLADTRQEYEEFSFGFLCY